MFIWSHAGFLFEVRPMSIIMFFCNVSTALEQTKIKWKVVFNQGLGYYQVNITTERETRDGIIAVQG